MKTFKICDNPESPASSNNISWGGVMNDDPIKCENMSLYCPQYPLIVPDRFSWNQMNIDSDSQFHIVG